MAKGKKGKKGKKANKEQTNEITEVEREIFHIQIADLTAKVERLKARCLELEASNVEFEENIKQLDEDRGDVITYLKTQTDQKQDEIEELEDRVEGLIQARENDVTMYKEIVRQNEHDFKIMHEQLTSEIKLLTGKLNSLEDFRIQRDELVKKFKNQEEQMSDQEEKHKQLLYEVEKKFIIAKDKLKKEMEGKLLQLSSNFSDATELRIAATTHHAIRENIAINNELDLMIGTHNKLTAENERIKKSDKELRLNLALVEEEKNLLLKRNSVLLKLLNRLAKEHQDMEENLAILQHDAQISENCQLKLQLAEKDLEMAQYETRLEKQKVQGALYEQEQLRFAAEDEKLRGDKLNAVIQTCVNTIQEAISTTEGLDPESALDSREALLQRLLHQMDTSTLQYIAVPTIHQPEKQSVYETGDLGLVPKSSISESKSVSKTSMETKSSSTSVMSQKKVSKTSQMKEKPSPSKASSSASASSSSSLPPKKKSTPKESLPANRTSIAITEKTRPSGTLQLPGGRKSSRKTSVDDEKPDKSKPSEEKEPKHFSEAKDDMDEESNEDDMEEESNEDDA